MRKISPLEFWLVAIWLAFVIIMFATERAV